MLRPKCHRGDQAKAVIAAAVIAMTPSLGIGQTVPVAAPVTAGSEAERYLRALSLTGIVHAPQWTVRPFAPTELFRMKPIGPHPWSQRFFPIGAESHLAILSPTLSLTENSSFPYGFNDGPVWAGRGLTIVGSGGLDWHGHSFSVAIDPVAFVTQNANFDIVSNGLAGRRSYADWLNPTIIDLPQRFGSGVYGRIDFGESHLRWDRRWFAIGAATESEVWGPAVEHPIILGNNAGGFPRVFLGTASPVDVGPVRLHGRIFWGRLDQSRFGPSVDSQPYHLATAAIGTMSLAGAPGLEIGAARFFHVLWPTDGLGGVPWLRVFEGVLKSSLSTSSNPMGNSSDNQLASMFFRWAPPSAGFEVYGEYGREDHNGDLRDLAKQPDHDAAYMVGFQRAWSNPERTSLMVVRGELLNSRISHLQQADPQTPWYVHGAILQGHTQRGQVLGSAAGYGGGGSSVAVDRYTPDGRTTVRWDRLTQATRRNNFGLPVGDSADVVHALSIERLRTVHRIDLTASATIAREFNRHFANDATNLSVSLSVRVRR
jgi:hypothetical protein